MQADTADDHASVEDLEDLTAAVARLEATADALDARLAPAPGAAAGAVVGVVVGVVAGTVPGAAAGVGRA